MRQRMRRGKVVDIPEEWQGKVTHRQTIRKRRSKMTGKAKAATVKPGATFNPRERTENRAPRQEEWDDESS